MGEDALTTKEANALVKSPKIRDMVEQLDKIVADGLACAQGLFTGSNPDADIPLKEASTRTRFGMELTKQALADRREKQVTDRVLGVLILRGRMREDEWEQHAAEVDEAERNKAAIDVEVKP